MPQSDAIVSEITVPTKASAMEIFSAAKKYGAECGRPTFSRISRGRAPTARSTSRISGSMVASPVARLIATGTNDDSTAVITAGTAPVPNHTTRIGTIATLGTVLNAIIRGLNAL